MSHDRHMRHVVKMATATELMRLLLFKVCLSTVLSQEHTFEINYDQNTFMKDGEPFRYISGSIHYQRVPYEYWDDRLKKMAAAGLNAIETYVPWNAHEKMQSQFDFSFKLDISTFLQTAHKYNLSVILRPGPYICAEWEFGGLPAWLLKYPDIKVRTMDQRYISAVDKWLTKLYTVIRPLLHKNGGPVITVQIENEYGSYPACDYNYLKFLRDKARSILGNDTVLFTTDGDGDGYLKCGTLPDVYSTIDFGITDTPEKNFKIQRHKEPKGPLVNSEFYVGWLDHWGEKHSTVNKDAASKSLDLILKLGANVNMYMFEGGTNFGFWNGAEYLTSFKANPTVNDYHAPLSEAGEISCNKTNCRQGANTPFQPCPTSYDYDAPLSEAGDITDKYMTLRKVIGKYNPLPPMNVPPSTPKYAYGKVELSFVETILDYVLDVSPVRSEYPVTMETLDHYYGFVLYQHQLTESFDYAYLNMSGLRDRGQLMVGSKTQPVTYGFVQRGVNPIYKISGQKGDYVHILVENMGRINYGGQLNNNLKGIISNLTLNGTILTDWLQYPIKSEDVQLHRAGYQQPPFASSSLIIPSIYQGTFSIEDDPMDTYIDMSQWVKGQLFINGVNLGRYWPKEGPQVRLYVPKYALKTGKNTVTVFELEGMQSCGPSTCFVDFTDQPLVNGTVPGVHGKYSPVYGQRGRPFGGDLEEMIDLQTIQYYVSVQTPVKTDYPVTMETLDHYYGYVLYQHQLTEDVSDGDLDLTGVRDRGYLMIGSKPSPEPYAIVQRHGDVFGRPMVVKINARKDDYLHILVENMGRIGYTRKTLMNDNHKGIITNVTLNGAILTDWLQYPIAMSDGFALNTTVNQTIPDMSSTQILPSVYGGSFLITDDPMDTYIDMSQWTKGVLFINGMNMGRYWPMEGPQVHLFVPKYTLQIGWNRVILIELEGIQCSEPSACDVEFKDKPLINATVPSSSANSVFFPALGNSVYVQCPLILFGTTYLLENYI